MAWIIILGNEKGGSGKSTTAMHVATALARMGHKTGAIDLDLRQKSFARYIENRKATLQRRNIDLPCPVFEPLPQLDLQSTENPELETAFADAVDTLKNSCDFIVIDCPGSHTRLSQVAHGMGDTLLTPINDSFVDFDLLGRIDPETYDVLSPSVYSEMVWQARQARAQAGQKPIDWIVVRSRLGSQEMRNKRKVGDALAALSHRIGFRLAPGFSERVVFREMFPMGLTLLDLPDLGVEKLSMSNIAARQELRDLMRALNLPNVKIEF
jgi:chromosome partitioning protein